MRKFYDFMRFYKSQKPVGVVEAAGSNPVTQTMASVLTAFEML